MLRNGLKENEHAETSALSGYDDVYLSVYNFSQAHKAEKITSTSYGKITYLNYDNSPFDNMKFE
jgi:hypothetical protein